MGRKGFDFDLEIENVTETELFQDENFTKPIQQLIDETPFPISEVGFYENNGNFAIKGQVVRETKKEAEAEYTIFKEKLVRILKVHFKKAKSIDRMKLYFQTIN